LIGGGNVITGKQLKLRRIELDIKAKEIAEYLHIDKSYISKLENGVQNIPVHIYKKWSEFLGVMVTNEIKIK
jgi:transcriptional regulator with XRE-family HTH domain